MTINYTYIGPNVYEYDLHWAICSLRVNGVRFRVSDLGF